MSITVTTGELPLHYKLSDPQVVETDDVLEINGTVFHKPFVEKPIDAENHNIYIYFPSDYGGGAQRLFRKVIKYSFTLVFLLYCIALYYL